MTDETKQAVVETTDTPPAAGSEVTGARNDEDELQKLLSQYEEATRPPPPPPPVAAATPEISVLANQMQNMNGELTAMRQEQFKNDIGKAVESIRGDLDPNVFDNELVESWLDAQARKDERLQKVWNQRHQNPRDWQRAQETLGKLFQTKIRGKLPDRNATEDRDAVAAAVRGASTQAPAEQPQNWKGMTNAEYREAVRKLGLDPQV